MCLQWSNLVWKMTPKYFILSVFGTISLPILTTGTNDLKFGYVTF